MEVPREVADELKAIREDVSRRFDDKIRDLSRQAEAKWDEFGKNPDALIGNAVKALLDDKAKTIEEKAEAMQKALTDRMDEMETKAAGRLGAEDPSVEVKAVLDKWGFNAHEFGSKSRIEIPTKAVVTITNANAGGATFVAPGPQIIEYPQRPLRMRDVIMGGTMTGSHFKFERELAGSMEGDADYQGGASPAEGATKPSMDIYTEIVTREVAQIAVYSVVSQQVFDDRPLFISFLRGRMGQRVLQFLDGEIINGVGNGTNGELEGINTIATAYNNSHVGNVTNAQRLDVLRYALNQVELAFYVPNYIALHPTDVAVIETLKDGDQRYIVGDPQTGGSTNRVPAVWGVPIVKTASQTLDDFTVGDGMASQLFVREEMEILASTEDGDNFKKNLVTIRAEMRALLANYSATAHVTGDFSDSIAAT